MSRPDVTVVIPTRDRPALVTRAIASAVAQRDTAVEVVVVDDGSAKPLAVADGVRLVRHERSLGVAAARNAGIVAARGRWIAFLDDDDFWAPHKLAAQRAAAEAASADLVYAGALVVSDGRVVNGHPAPAARTLREQMRRANVVPAGSSNVMVRAEILEAVGAFDGRLRHLADWDLWSRMLEVAVPACVEDDLVAYVQHAASMHIEEIGSVVRESVLLRELHRDGPISHFDSGMFALFVAESHRQSGRHWAAAKVYGAAGLRHRRRPYLRSAASEALRAAGLRRQRVRETGPTPLWITDQWDSRGR